MSGITDMTEKAKNSRGKAYAGGCGINTQEARPFSEWSGARTPNRASWVTRSMRQSELTDHQSVGESRIELSLDVDLLNGRPATVDPEHADSPWRDKQLLEQLYVENLLSPPDISDVLGCAPCTISDWLSRHEIPTRDMAESVSVATLGRENYIKLSDAEWLRERYIGQKKSDHDIAEELGCAVTTVGNFRDDHGIPVRDHSVSVSMGKFPPGVYEKVTDPDWLREQYVELEKSDYTIADEIGSNHETVRTTRLRYGIDSLSVSESISVAKLPPETREKLSDGDWLREQYVENRRSDRDLAAELDCDRATIRRHRSVHDISPHGHLNIAVWGGSHNDIRKYLKRHLGSGSWVTEIATRVRRRDNWQCQMPACDAEQSDEAPTLHVHHISPLLDAGCNEDDLLISLCPTCHQVAEFYTHQNIIATVPGRSFIEVAEEFAAELEDEK